MVSKRQILDTLADTLKKLKAEGADYAEATYDETSAISVGVRNGVVESLQKTAGETSITLHVRVGDKVASVSPNTKRADLLAASMSAVVAAARLKTDNPDQALPDRALLSRIRNNRQLDLVDRTKPSTDEMIRKLQIAESAARAVPHIKDVDGAGYNWSIRREISLSSTDDIFEDQRSKSSFGISVLAENGGPLSTDHESTSARYQSDLRDPAVVGRLAAEKAVAALNPRKAPEGHFPVVFDPDMAAGLLSHFTQAVAGESIFMNQSFLSKDSLGQQVLSSGITIINDPHKQRGFGSTMYNGAGLPTSRLVVVEKGELKSLFLGLESARRLGFPLTAIKGSPGNLTIQPGTVTKQALLEGIKEGFYVTNVMGQGVSVANGNYSRGASGFWIKDGILTYAVAEATIAGNLRDMFMNIVAANDLDVREKSIASPTLRIDGMTIA